jgi:hypothetical protein
VPTQKRLSKPAPATPAFVPPYPPSWLNRLIAWIDRRPGPAWAYYIGGLLLLGAVTVVGQVLAGEPPTDTLVFSVYPVYLVALIHYLDGEARSALVRFRPALSLTDTEFARIEYQLTTVPARGAWLATALAIPLGFLFILGGESDPLSAAALPSTALAVTITTFNVAAFFVLAFHTVRQLRQVSQLHAEVRTINLLQPRPTYAFSRLTSRTALGVAAFFYLDFLVNPPTPGVALPYFAVAGASLVLMLAAFLLPLLGMHQRLAAEKARLEAEVNEGVELAYRGLQKQVRSKSYEQVDSLEKSLSGLLRMREIVGRLSTWPWQPETLRGMLAAVALPMVLWLIQYGLQKLLG